MDIVYVCGFEGEVEQTALDHLFSWFVKSVWFGKKIERVIVEELSSDSLSKLFLPLCLNFKTNLY